MNAPEPINDTALDAEEILIQLIRQQTPTQRVSKAIAASNLAAQQCKDAIRRANPGISEEEVGLRFIELNYGRKLAQEVRLFLAEQ
ncbi:MAG: hypothetical protein R3C03_10690 [Pirellulaceae bacterium]